MNSIVCKVPQHAKEKIEFYCFNPYCKEARLICFQCETENQHISHQSVLFNLSKFPKHAEQLSKQSQELIDKLLNLKFNVQDCIDELVQKLVQKLKQKFQQQPNNLDQFTYDQLESYLEGLLDFDQNNKMIQDNAISYIKLAIKNIEDVIEDVIEGLEVKAGLHYKAPPELQQKVIDLQNQGTQLNFQEFYFYTGDSLRGRFKFAEALKCYEKTIQQDPNNTQALLGKAHCLRKDRKFQEAKTIYERILSQNPNNIQALWGLADLLRIQGRDEEAIKQYEKVLRINNQHVESISGKGDCNRLLGRFDEAMKFLKQAQQINPKHVLTLTRIGDCLRQQKKFSDAINYYSQALSIDPQDEWSQSKINECRTVMQKYY